MTPPTVTARSITASQIRALSIAADREDRDGLFALCAKASRGDMSARAACAAEINRRAVR